MRIAILAAGAAGMYCGSCLRDSTLAVALRQLGHDALLIPLYTPLRLEGPDTSIPRIFFGGINVYLAHRGGPFARLPGPLRWLLDRPALLRLAGRWGGNMPPAQLGALTIDILRGPDGPTRREGHQLLDFLRPLRPDVISLPNLMFLGLAPLLRSELRVPIVCELTGEDIFIDALPPADQSECRRLIRAAAAHVSAFVATSDSYASRMADYLALPREKIAVVYPGIPESLLASEDTLARRPLRPAGPPRIAYLARLDPAKGFDRLLEALRHLRSLPGMADAQLHYAGYLAPHLRPWHADLLRRAAAEPHPPHLTYLGEVDVPAKAALLDSCDLLCVPTAYPESKGLYILEALARGLPVVQPAHGSFPELLAHTGGGLLAEPNNPAALAHRLAELLADRPLQHQLGRQGWQAVRAQFLARHMAAAMADLYQRCQTP